MTREEAIKMLKSKMDGNTDTSYEWAETVRMAIKELEQEPTPKNDSGVDAVSRAEVLKIFDEWFATCDIADKKDSPKIKIKALPSVTPIRPKGHWKYDYTSADGHKTYHCSECGCYLQPKHSEPLNSFKWCSLCGADMREVENE